jgi:hypothetical protein
MLVLLVKTGATAGSQLLSSGLTQAAATQRAAGDAASGQLTGFMNQMLGAAMGSFGGFGGGGGGGGSNYYSPGNSSFGPSISRMPGGGFVGYGE